MKNILLTLRDGLNFKGYIRHFFFGSMVFLLLFSQALIGEHEMPIPALIFGIINTVLYPYARHCYERIVGFILGDTVIFANILLLGSFKVLSISLCWAAALIIAPFGLLMICLSRRRQHTN